LTKTGEYGFLDTKIETCFLAYEKDISIGADPERPPNTHLKEGEIT
jgi:hypothetical protein